MLSPCDEPAPRRQRDAHAAGGAHGGDPAFDCMEATVECLVELGWAGTTTTIVSERAGVSRGAQICTKFPDQSRKPFVAAESSNLCERRR